MYTYILWVLISDNTSVCVSTCVCVFTAVSVWCHWHYYWYNYCSCLKKDVWSIDLLWCVLKLMSELPEMLMASQGVCSVVATLVWHLQNVLPLSSLCCSVCGVYAFTCTFVCVCVCVCVCFHTFAYMYLYICNNNYSIALYPVKQLQNHNTVQYHNTNYRKKESSESIQCVCVYVCMHACVCVGWGVFVCVCWGGLCEHMCVP